MRTNKNVCLKKHEGKQGVTIMRSNRPRSGSYVYCFLRSSNVSSYFFLRRPNVSSYFFLRSSNVSSYFFLRSSKCFFSISSLEVLFLLISSLEVLMFLLISSLEVLMFLLISSLEVLNVSSYFFLRSSKCFFLFLP